ncbi:hypothetical protein Br6_04900 [Rhodococcus sp. Br-6]|nr:hypothetical protein Br6_04900 [Rhodococcus sp. Br-6]
MGSNFSEPLQEITMGSTMPFLNTVGGSVTGSVMAVMNLLKALTFGG